MIEVEVEILRTIEVEVDINPALEGMGGDGEAILKNTEGTIISTTPIPPEQSVDIEVADVVIDVYKDNALQQTANIPYNKDETININWN